MSFHEISHIPIVSVREHILEFVNKHSSFFVGVERENETKLISQDIIKTGIKQKDAIHLACSVIAESDYFVTTDKRVINCKSDLIKTINPIEFVKIWGEKK
jgi:hypothetical protein